MVALFNAITKARQAQEEGGTAVASAGACFVLGWGDGSVRRGGSMWCG